MSNKHFVAGLDVWAPAVRAVMQEVAPPHLDLHFATSYDEAEQMALVKDAEVILAGWAAVTQPMIEHASKLRFIEKWGVGYDRIDIEAARRKGIPVAITAGSNAGPVAELAIALMLGVYRRIAWVDSQMRQGHWVKSEMREIGLQLFGKTIGIVGFGNIGQQLARKLRGFDATILYFDPHGAEPSVEQATGARRVELDFLIANSDIVSLHAPLNRHTEKLINVASIATMKKGAVLINTARGELVDEDALHAALVSGHLMGAGLDAFQEEPAPKSHPLLTLPQVVATPHIGGAVFDNVANVARHAFGNIDKFLSRQPLRAADVVVPLA